MSIEISFDDVTTEVPLENEIFRDSFENFKYPLVPEEFPSAENEHRLEDAIPKDFDMSQTNLSVVAMNNPSSEIFSGRANCRKRYANK